MARQRSVTARIVDWVFIDRATGRYVIAQWPNWPLWLFAASGLTAWAVAVLAPQAPPQWRVGLGLVAKASLAWWAFDEILRGVNPWRRFLGATGLAVVAWSIATAA